ncbi:MAG: hypothetical protein ABSF64_02660 [Bryobacteraceae bacterium]|jgi:hypothetical protein
MKPRAILLACVAAACASAQVMPTLPGTTSSGGIAVGDVTGDGYPDIVSSEGYIVFGTASGASPPVSYAVVDFQGTHAIGLVLADLRTSGLTDIVTDSYGGVSVILSLGKGKYEDGEWTAAADGADCGVTGDSMAMAKRIWP